jgi:hypothetical protein
MSAASKKTLVVRNGTLIDGSGKPAARNDAIVIEGNRIKSVGALPGDVELEDRRTVEVIDAGGQWIMPGLIDAHCHVSYGYPVIKGEGKGRGTTRPEFSTLKSARSVQKVLRSGVTGISVPGGTWFTDVGVRDAIKLGLMEGPRMYVAGRMIVTYGCIEDDEPSWEGTPDHSIGKLCNTGGEMVTEVRRQANTGSTSSRWRTAAPANRRCWRKRRSQPSWRRRIDATCASAFTRAARGPPVPPRRPASIGSFTPISPPTATSKPWPRPACRSFPRPPS